MTTTQADEAEPLDWGPRGTCPFCGSGSVFHDVLGMPTFEAFESAPPWVSFGCMPTHEDRHCGACGRGWTSDDDPEDEDVDEDDAEGEVVDEDQ